LAAAKKQPAEAKKRKNSIGVLRRKHARLGTLGLSKKNLEAMIANALGNKDQAEGGVEEFSPAGRNYFRVNLARGAGGRHQCIICTTSNDHLLIWSAGAPNEK